MRLKITPFGIIVFSVCLISGLAGLNIFTTELYRIFSLSFSLLIVSYFSRIKKGSKISITVFFDRKYYAGEKSKFSVTLFNEGLTDLSDLEIIPVVEKLIPAKDEFIRIKEPGERKRNIWDRNIYYFRWSWHILRLHKIEFRSIKVKSLKHNSSISAEADFFPVKRGKVRFEGFYLLKKDIFGIFTTSEFYQIKDEIVILPKIIKLDSVLKKQFSFDKENKNRSLINQVHKHKAGDFIGLRDYAPGDPVKNIHWKTWAKTGKPAVVEKGYEKIKEYSIFLINIADKDESDYWLMFEDCVSYLYSALKYLEENNFEVDFHYFTNSGDLIHFRAEKEKGNFLKLYNICSSIGYYNSDTKKTLDIISDKLKNNTNSMIFSVSADKNIINMVYGFKSLFFTCDEILTGSKNVFLIPRINKFPYQVNIT